MEHELPQPLREAAALGATLSEVSRTLESRGLLSRARHPTGGRLVPLKLLFSDRVMDRRPGAGGSFVRRRSFGLKS
ncbi:hypothetical protein [Streptomyces canus]|uniref:hypothetical protein n=1 Tax=Streptomyces canus TaxID=58343 RepID=UPI00037433D9